MFEMKVKKNKVLSEKAILKLEEGKKEDISDYDIDLGIVKNLIDYILRSCNLPATWSVFITS